MHNMSKDKLMYRTNPNINKRQKEGIDLNVDAESGQPADHEHELAPHEEDADGGRVVLPLVNQHRELRKQRADLMHSFLKYLQLFTNLILLGYHLTPAVGTQPQSRHCQCFYNLEVGILEVGIFVFSIFKVDIFVVDIFDVDIFEVDIFEVDIFDVDILKSTFW
jgi:hypothetical protein